jgi:uncharacterized protein YndB with AHSA1/START domain
MTAKPSLTIVRRFRASPARAYAAWTRPEMMATWFGPHHTRVESAECDPRIGGRFRVVMRAEDGERHDVSGVFREVVPERKLVFTWAMKAAGPRRWRGWIRSSARKGTGPHRGRDPGRHHPWRIRQMEGKVRP